MAIDDLHPRTRRFIQTADENEQFARDVLSDPESKPAALRWAAIALFYAAVHDVNAYLWERARLEPKHHEDREQLMFRWPDLAPLVRYYTALKNHAWRARYAPGAESPRHVVEGLLMSNLDPLRRSIRASLNF
jgi:hypothetical protein